MQTIHMDEIGFAVLSKVLLSFHKYSSQYTFLNYVDPNLKKYLNCKTICFAYFINDFFQIKLL